MLSAITKTKIKATMRYHHKLIRIGKTLKTDILSISKNMESELSYYVGGDIK